MKKYTGKTLNDVLNSAAKEKGVSVEELTYKEERYEKVKSIAGRIAKTVQRTKVDASLDPMPNDERKVIHQYLSDWPYIKTESEGEGSRRHLKIMYDRTKTAGKK